MVTVTSKLFLFALFVFGFLEVSCRRRIIFEDLPPNLGKDDSLIGLGRHPEDMVRGKVKNEFAADEGIDRNDNNDERNGRTPQESEEATKPTATESPPEQNNRVSTTPLPSGDTVSSNSSEPTKKYMLKKKDHFSLTGFAILAFSGYSLSANFIVLMLLLTNKMCVSKKKQSVLQSPTPIVN